MECCRWYLCLRVAVVWLKAVLRSVAKVFRRCWLEFEKYKRDLSRGQTKLSRSVRCYVPRETTI